MVVEITFGENALVNSTIEQVIKEAIVAVAGGDVNVEVVEVVVDEQGKAVSVVVRVDDETAQAIVAFVNDNKDRPASEECTPVMLCRAKEAKLVGLITPSPSTATRPAVLGTFLLCSAFICASLMS